VGHVRVPLYQNSYALVLGAAGTSILGVAYWAVATHAYPARDVGVQSALVSTMLFLAGLSQLSLNSVLIRFLPVSGRRSGRLIGVAYAASTAAAVVAASIFVVGTPLWSSRLAFLLHDPAWFVAFVAATAVWCVFALQDSVLAALRRATWVPAENIGVSVAKIALLLLFESRLVHAGLFASWTIPAAGAVVAVNLLLYRTVVPTTKGVASIEDYTLRGVTRFAGGNYVGFIFYAASANLLPLLVLSRSGPTEAAYFFLPWTITSALLVVAASTATSLTVETVRDMDRLHSYCRRTLLHTLAMLALPVAFLFIATPELLHLFGSGYAHHGATTLRLLTLGSLPNAVVLIGLGLLRIRGRVVQLAALQGVLCVLILGLSYLLLPRYGITGVGVAFASSQTIGAMWLLLGSLRPVVRLPRAAAMEH
jgi:O-antigen/teichoic acid export membrane protein